MEVRNTFKLLWTFLFEGRDTNSVVELVIKRIALKLNNIAQSKKSL